MTLTLFIIFKWLEYVRRSHDRNGSSVSVICPVVKLGLLKAVPILKTIVHLELLVIHEQFTWRVLLLLL